MGVYRGVLLDLHKNRLARYQKNQIAKQKAEKDKRTSNIALLKTEVPVHEENGKYYITNKKGELEEVDKGLYDSQVERNRLAQVARGELEATYNIPPTLQKQREDHYNTEAEKFKAQEADSIKSEAEFARRKAEALKNKPIDKVVNEAVVDPSIQPDTKHSNTRQVFPEKPMVGSSPLDRLRKAETDRAQLITGKDPNKVAPQTMASVENVMEGQIHPKATNLLANNNLGGMVVGQAPNTGMVNFRQGEGLSNPNLANVKANPFKTRQDSMFGGKIKPTPKYNLARKTPKKLDLPSANVIAQNNKSSISARPVTRQDAVDKANKKTVGTMGAIGSKLLSKPSEVAKNVNERISQPSSYNYMIDAIKGMLGGAPIKTLEQRKEWDETVSKAKKQLKGNIKKKRKTTGYYTG
jgi:hypothetical protein